MEPEVLATLPDSQGGARRCPPTSCFAAASLNVVSTPAGGSTTNEPRAPLPLCVNSKQVTSSLAPASPLNVSRLPLRVR
eukprot:6184495-Prymnesium_polylepis.1